MVKPKLTTEMLLARGFALAGAWELNSARDLAHRIDLPKMSGVYAFAINGVVQYVGLASRSVAQRLGFYRKPGVSQRTNVRLNEIIRGHLTEGSAVQILIAHPEDHDWNGFKIKGSEGLEAGLIEEFELPWNMRGTVKAASQTLESAQPNSNAGGISQRIVDLVRERPGMTELEIAKSIYGPTALQPRVNQHCRRLVQAGQIERLGSGGISDPFIYRTRN